MKSKPLPRWLVSGNSAIVVAISAALVGMAIGMLTTHWDPSVNIAGLGFLPPTLAVGILQYAATFRKNARMAKIVAVIHLLGFALFGFALVTTAGENLLQGGSFRLDFSAIMLFITIYLGFCGWMNLRLAKQLRSAQVDTEHPAAEKLKAYQFTLRELLAGVLVVVIIASVTASFIHDSMKKYEEHISYQDAPDFGLPEDANDICYGRGARGYLAYEFNIDEAGFLAWAEEKRRESPSGSNESVNEIQKGGPFTIHVYTFLMPKEVLPASKQQDEITIPQGYFFEYITGDEGFKIAYDSATGRAYYFRF